MMDRRHRCKTPTWANTFRELPSDIWVVLGGTLAIAVTLIIVALTM